MESKLAGSRPGLELWKTSSKLNVLGRISTDKSQLTLFHSLVIGGETGLVEPNRQNPMAIPVPRLNWRKPIAYDDKYGILVVFASDRLYVLQY
jgi:hypothetical protein